MQSLVDRLQRYISVEMDVMIIIRWHRRQFHCQIQLLEMPE